MSKFLSGVKYFFFLFGLIVNFFFPIYISGIVDDKRNVLISLIFFTSIAVFLAVEESKLTIKESNDKINEKLDKFEEELKTQLTVLSSTNKMYESIRRIKNDDDIFFYELARKRIEDLEQDLHKAEDGQLVLDSAQTTTLALHLANNIKSSLYATALWGKDWKGGPLSTPLKDTYLTVLANKKKVNRQITQKRLFLIEHGTELDKEFRTRVLLDQKNGVEVKYLFIEDWIETQEVPRPEDFAIWDQARVWCFKHNPTAMSHANRATLTCKKKYVDLYMHAFNANWECGLPLDVNQSL